MDPNTRIEQLLWRQGVERVAGVDEAGRGAWAGPVVAAAVVLPRSAGVLEQLVDPAAVAVRDSKLLTPPQRTAAAERIRCLATDVGVGVVPREIVDELGLSCAGQLAFWRAVHQLSSVPDYLLVDGFPLWSPTYRQAAVLQGDRRCLSIAAASVVAKVARDEIMRRLDLEAPGYGFAHNCGYGTPEHRQALRAYGPSPHHRTSYQPVAEALAATSEPAS
jgi:ribonuclease HII